MSDDLKCSVRDGRFVEPCTTLASTIENHTPAFSKAKGMAFWRYTNFRTGHPSRSFVGILSKSYPKGMLFNFCPFCGGNISAPFTEADDQPAVLPPETIDE
jgi:hypothetical protein